MSLHDIWLGDVMPASGVAVTIGRNSYDPPAPVVPVFDIHARSLVLHDSGYPAQSGIIQYNSTNNRLELIPANSGMESIMTAVYLDAYDGTGGTNIGGTAITVPLDTLRTSNSQGTGLGDVFVYFSTAVIQINRAGVYDFEYRGSADVDVTGTRSIVQWWLERLAPGGSWTEEPGTRAWSYHRIDTGGEGTANARCILDDVVVGDSFRIRAQLISGTNNVITLADGCSLTIKKVE